MSGAADRMKCEPLMNVDLHQVFSTEKLYLTLTGFYPVEHGRYKLFYYLGAIINVSIACWQMISLLIYSYFHLKDLANLSEALLVSITHFAFMIKLANLTLRRRCLNHLEVLLKSNIFSELSPEERLILNSRIDEGKLLAKIYRTVCSVGLLFYTTFPFLDHRPDSDYKLPVPCGLPLNAYDYYYQIYFVDVLSLAFIAATNATIDLLTVMMMILASAEFEILNDRLANIIDDLDTREDEVKSRLRKCVLHYEAIIYYVKYVEYTFSKGIFIQFFCSVLVICIIAFMMLVTPFWSIQFIFLICYSLCMMCQVVMYCWYGHIIMESSDAITSACYMSKWNQCSLEVKKSLMIVMERAKQPASITAGNLIILNIPTMITILRSSYYYFTVLKNMYGND